MSGYRFRQISQASYAVLIILPLVGCGGGEQAAVNACMRVVEAGERFPSTISLIGSSSKFSNLTKDEFTQELAGGVLTPTTFAQAEGKVGAAPSITLSEITEYPKGIQFGQASLLKYWLSEAAKARQIGIQTVEINYDIDNGNGVPERKKGSCQFPLSDVDTRTPMVVFEESVRLEKLRKQSFGFDQTIPNKGYRCCIPKFAFADVSPSSGRFVGGELTGSRVAGGVIMYDEIELEVRNAMIALKARDQGAQ